jgi:nucleoid-associated protein YgaU
MTARKLYIYFLLCISIGFVSCDVDVPIKEMVKAKATITKARQVMAEKYDPENLNKAVDWLKKSHDNLVDKDAKNAKESAEQSIVYGEMAVQASLPKVVDDTLADAKSVYDEADKLNAADFAPEKFKQAGDAAGEAENLKSTQNLWDAFQKAKEAAAAGREAKEICMAKLPQLNDDLNKMKKEAEDLSAQHLTKQQMDDVASAKSKLDIAGESLSQNNIKDAVPLMSEAGALLAKVKTAGEKQSVKDRIAQLRREVEQLKKDRGTEFAGDDIGVVVGALNEADSLLEQDKLEDAKKKVTDAENSLAIAKEKTTKGLALDKAKSVEKLLEETRKKDTQNKYKTETDTAAEMIANGRKLIESESYKDSLLKFEEAESLLCSIGIAGEKKELKEKGELKQEEGKKIYEVIYNKKKRDCLWRIAGKVYSNARLWPLIYMANKDQIKDPDLIFPGQRFVIPDVPEKKEPQGKEKVEKEAIKDSTDKKESEKKEPDNTIQENNEGDTIK